MELTTPTTKQGFLIDHHQWNETIAAQIASNDNISLTPAHWEIIHFIRHYYLQYQHLPSNRQFGKAVRLSLGEDKGNSRYLHRLFPQGPIKFACKIAGLPKPPNCL